MDSLLTYAQENSTSGSSFSTLIWIVEVVGLWKMFEKANEPGWVAIVPFYNYYKLCEKVMNNGWYFIGLCIPIIRWFFKYQIGYATAKAYGKPDSWMWGYMFIPFVFYPMTGFDDSSYYGPMGAGDNRTGDARQAKTVDFDVVKNDPAQAAPNDAPTAEPVKETDEVEFTFDGSDE